MAYPSTAFRCSDDLDPQELLDFVIPLSTLLEDGEKIDSGDFTITVLAEAVALGLEVADDPDRAPILINNDMGIRIWLSIDPAHHGATAFMSGVFLPFEVTFQTTSTPPRIRQRTFIVKVREQ